jgi:hypothetical protein
LKNSPGTEKTAKADLSFLGPAGLLLDKALVEAGVDRQRIYVTNAVKHFKFEPRGKGDFTSGRTLEKAYVDDPACKGFEHRFGELVGRSHMSGPFVRRICPLALMELADRVPIKIARWGAR